MANKLLTPFKPFFMISLIVLLGIQLTGLSCLGEGPSLSSSSSTAFFNQHQEAGAAGVAQLEDGCPCHLSFVSGPNSLFSVCCPVTVTDAGSPATPALGNPSLPFRPPLSV